MTKYCNLSTWKCYFFFFLKAINTISHKNFQRLDTIPKQNSLYLTHYLGKADTTVTKYSFPVAVTICVLESAIQQLPSAHKTPWKQLSEWGPLVNTSNFHTHDAYREGVGENQSLDQEVLAWTLASVSTSEYTSVHWEFPGVDSRPLHLPALGVRSNLPEVTQLEVQSTLLSPFLGLCLPVFR